LHAGSILLQCELSVAHLNADLISKLLQTDLRLAIFQLGAHLVCLGLTIPDRNGKSQPDSFIWCGARDQLIQGRGVADRPTIAERGSSFGGVKAETAAAGGTNRHQRVHVSANARATVICEQVESWQHGIANRFVVEFATVQVNPRLGQFGAMREGVADQILHLERGKLTLWTGGYSSFERQRREQQALAGKAIRKQEERRAHLQAFVDRFRAKASKATQAQSRLKMLAKMEPIAAIVDETVQPFKWPPVARRLSPPIVTMEKVSAGYDGRAVLGRIDLTLADDDRIGLLGANGNGKSTFAKLIAGRLEPMAGRMTRAGKLQVGYFAQHQIDELEPGGSVYDHVAERMRGQPESKIRGRAAMIGFSGARAATRIEALSGGEKARLMMGLAAFDGPQLLILDEPTNHLDIDSRGELIEAINTYEGACILVSHDRRLLEACVDRLWLTANGTVKPFDGDLADYGRFVLGADARPVETRKRAPASPAPAAGPRRQPAPLKRELEALEDKMNRFHDLLRRVDEALAEASARGGDAGKIADLAEKRAELERALTASEEAWFELSAEAEGT